MKKITIMAGLLLLAWGADAKIPSKLLPTEADKTAMLNEADDFIDDMADGLQDRQSDAVRHALRGQTAELLELRRSRNVAPEMPKSIDVEDIVGDGSARGIAMRLYRPKDREGEVLPLLVYLHGGGWTIGSLNSCASFCSALAESGKVMVLAVDYALAPEKVFPAGMLDCVGAVEYAMSHSEEWGSAPSMVSLGGDSSGANLALATSLYMDEEKAKNGNTGKESLQSLVLFYPVVKAYSDKSASWKRYSRGYGLDGRLMEAFNEAYIGDGDSRNALISPSDATDEQLRKLPPVLIINAERDILYDQGKEFSERIRRIGNDGEWIEFPGAVHLFITVKGQPTAFSKAAEIASAFIVAGKE